MLVLLCYEQISIAILLQETEIPIQQNMLFSSINLKTVRFLNSPKFPTNSGLEKWSDKIQLTKNKGRIRSGFKNHNYHTIYRTTNRVEVVENN